MAEHEVIWRVLARMDDGQCESQRMRYISVRVHQTLLARVYLQNAASFIPWQDRLDRVSLLAADPVWLHKGPLLHDISVLEIVAVGFAGEGRSLNLSGTFDVRWHEDADLHNLKPFDPDETGVVVWHLEAVLEKWGASSRKRQKNLGRNGRTDVLLFGIEWDMRVADFQRPGKEIPTLSRLAVGTDEQASFWIRWARE